MAYAAQDYQTAFYVGKNERIPLWQRSHWTSSPSVVHSTLTTVGTEYCSTVGVWTAASWSHNTSSHSTALVAYMLADSLQTLYFNACSAYRTLPSLSGRHRFADITPTNQKWTSISRLHELHYTSLRSKFCVFLCRTSSLEFFTCRSTSNSRDCSLQEKTENAVLTWLLTLCNNY